MKGGLPIAAALFSVLGGCTDSPAPANLRERGQAALDRGDLEGALALAERGHRAAIDAGDRAEAWSMEVLRAEVMVTRRDMKGALRLLDDPPPAKVGPALVARRLMIRANALCVLEAHRRMPAEEQPEELLTQADQIARDIASIRLTAEVAVRRGVCDFHRASYEQAEMRYRQGLTAARAAGIRHVEAQAAVGLGLIRVYTARYDDAADWFERSLRLSAGDAIELKSLGNLGWCYTMLGDTEKALPLLIKAEQMATRRGLVEDAEIALFHLANVHLQLQDVRSARAAMVRALGLARRLDRKADQLEALGLLQTIALQEGDVAGARAYSTEVANLIASSSPGGRAPAPSLVEARLHAQRREFDKARQMYERIARVAEDVASGITADQRWQALAGIARIEVELGRKADAERAFRRAQEAIDRMRAGFKQDTFDFLLYSSLNDFYGGYAAFLIDQGRVHEALALIDRNRGRVLWDRLGPAGATASPPERFEVAARKSQAVLLSYWLGQRSFLWVVTEGSTEVHELPSATDLRARVERYDALVQRSRDPLALSAAETGDLYRLLIGPAEARIPKGSRVVIVPDGALHLLSFDTLVVPSPAPHYWVEDVVTMRAPSLALLTVPRAKVAPDRAVLAIGDPVQPTSEFPALPNAGREMIEVARHFPADKVLVVTGSEATPSAYRDSDPSRFAYIHFAAHATSHAERPLESAVVLSPREVGFKLYAHEILNIPIRAEVVTLSACRGAGARTYSGEGLVGFAWGFLRAGARSVVAGLWNVEDASTSRVMSGLYSRLAAGLAPPEALREARLELLREPGAYRKPYYWGPFVVYVQQQGA